MQPPKNPTPFMGGSCQVLGQVTELHDGEIHWRNGWRRYVMHFDRDCDWSVECMAQCYKFIQKLMEDRKKDGIHN